MKTLKKLATLCIAFLMLFSVTASVGCGGAADSSSDQTLEIFLLYKGYQDEWLTSTIELFEQEDWVKEKYPELDVDLSADGTDSLPFSKLQGGASLNTYDLMFGVNLNSMDQTGYIADLTDLVYLAEVPGEEGVKVIDKIPTDTLSAMASSMTNTRTDEYDTYYALSYIRSMFGMMYNADHLDTMGVEVPLTTEQFKAICQKAITDGYSYTLPTGSKTSNVAIINASEDNYWASSFDNWWAQYEGYDEYENFFGGWWGDERSNKVLTQTGRLRSLEEIENIFQADYGYASANAVDYKYAQSNFLGGMGVFHYNGDYFASEMANNIEAFKGQGVDFDIRFMKMPILSSIVEKLSFYTSVEGTTEYKNLTTEKKKQYDDILAAAIKDIDADKLYDASSVKTLMSKKDFEKIAEARCMAGYTKASAQTAVIPSYSPAKELAADFLRYMYTDKAIKNFSVSSKGVLLPTTSTLAYQDDLYASYSSIQQSKIDIMKGTSNYPYTVLPSASSYPLGKAGLDSIVSFTSKFEVMFAIKTGTRKTALQIYQDDIAYWDDNTWGQTLSSAGLKG